MKHIYIIDEHQSSKQNGVGTYIQQLLNCFEGSEHDVNLLSFNSDEKEFKVERSSFFTEYHFPICGNHGFLQNGALSISILRLYLSDNKDNVFFVNHSPCVQFLKTIKKQFPLSRIIFVIHDQGWCAPLLGDVDLFKKVISVRHIPKDMIQKWQFIRRYYREECKMYSIVDDVVSLAEQTKRILEDIYYVKSSKIHLIPNGRKVESQLLSEKELARLRMELGIGKDENVFLYAGRTVESKGIIPLLMAFESAYKKYKDIRLVIAGQVFMLNDYARITKCSCSHIVYTGLIPGEEMEKWYQVADVCVLPSYTEQCSYFGIEMLAHGKLIVATTGHNMKEMFNKRLSIILNNIGATGTNDLADRLAKAFLNVLKISDNQQKRYKREARLQYEKKYMLEHMRYSYIQLIDLESKKYSLV